MNRVASETVTSRADIGSVLNQDGCGVVCYVSDALQRFIESFKRFPIADGEKRRVRTESRTILARVRTWPIDAASLLLPDSAWQMAQTMDVLPTAVSPPEQLLLAFNRAFVRSWVATLRIGQLH
jgi:hypothetical protein